MKNSLVALGIFLSSSIMAYAVDGQVNIYVSTSGNDLNEGLKDCPVATLERAIELASLKRIEPGVNELHIIMYGGVYYLPETVVISDKVVGNPAQHLFIESAEGENPVLSGAIPVSGWRKSDVVQGLPDIAVGNVIVADVPVNDKQFRQMWVNGNRAQKASNHDDLSLPRIISKDSDGNGLVVPELPYSFHNPQEVETTIIQDWAMNILRVKSIRTENQRTYLKFCDTESNIEFKRPWPILRADEQSYSNHHFKLSNAIELLNRPREWYNDANQGKLYYWPAFGENPDDIKVEVPVLETIISIEGTKENPVNNITFRGITFSHSTWMRPAEAGHIALQAGLFLWDAYSQQTATANNVAWVGRPEAGVKVAYASDILFENCRFEHLGSTGLDFVTGVKNATVKGSIFNDIGGNGILAGFFGDEEFEVHQAWNPEDRREVCDNILIDNNYISHPAVEDWGCLAIAVGYASNITISHNEIFDTPYSAINMGWGWIKDESIMRNNHIIGNYIHSFSNQMRDSGAIYTLSSQPDSSIEQNRIEDVGDPLNNPVMWDMRHSQFDLYTDEGTDYFKVKNNWCERGEYSKNQNGPHNIWSSNGPSVSEIVKNAAGLQEGYRHLPSTVKHPVYTPADSIADKFDREDIIDYISPSDGFKLGTSTAVDLNNDGLMDIVFSGGESFQVQQGGVRINMGNYHFASTQGLRRLFMGNFDVGDLDGDGNVDLIQCGWDFWSSYNAILHNDSEGHLTEIPLKSSDTAPACGITDLNCDGYPDYFFIGNGSATSFNYQNVDRSFSKQSHVISGLPGGFSDPNVVYGDFNNDGFVDLWILSNKTGGVFTEIFWNDGKGYFTKGESGVTPKGTRGGMACADLNGDGWLDIVIGGTVPGEAWNTTASEGGKIVTVYLNDKNGHFSKKQEFSEYMFDNTTHPVKIIDWNNDGYSDIILTGWNMSQGNISRTHIYLNDGKANFTLADIHLPGVSESSIETADFSNSGRCDILINGNCNGGYQGFSVDRRISVLCKNKIEKINSIPSAPTNLSSLFENDILTLSWDEGVDEETPSESLTYNYYIRDLDTGIFITSPDADINTGHRKINSMGNAWLNKKITVRNLPTGRYGWSVQTLDSSNAGSEFAPEKEIYVQNTGINQLGVNSRNETSIYVDDTIVRIVNPVKDKINIYSIEGCCIGSPDIISGEAVITLSKGVYIIDGIKILI